MDSTCSSYKFSFESVKAIPKIELHAHLNGCVRRSTLEEFSKEKMLNHDFSCFAQRDNEGQFRIFDIIRDCVTTLADVSRVTNEVLQDFRNDGVIYLELRTTPKDTAAFTSIEYVETILRIMESYNTTEPFFQSRLILSIDRGSTVEKARETLRLFTRIGSALLVGIDYSGNPEKNSFCDFKQIFEEAAATSVDQTSLIDSTTGTTTTTTISKTGIKTTIHAAVISGETTLQETKQILNFKPDRIGHFNFFNAELLELVRTQKIPVELCPTSNFFTRELESMHDHQFRDLFLVGSTPYPHAVSISTDDTCVFDTSSTNELLTIITTFNLTEEQIIQILNMSADMIFDVSVQNHIKSLILSHFKSTQK